MLAAGGEPRSGANFVGTGTRTEGPTMDPMIPVAEAERLLRLQRHDFLNHIQVLYTLLQMGKHDRALAYIQKLSAPDALTLPPIPGEPPHPS